MVRNVYSCGMFDDLARFTDSLTSARYLVGAGVPTTPGIFYTVGVQPPAKL